MRLLEAAVAVVLAVAGDAVAAPSVLDRVEVVGNPATAVRLHLSAPAAASAVPLGPSADAAHRVYVDLAGATIGPTLSRIVPGSGPLLRVRVGQFDRTTARVVLDLATAVPFTVQRTEQGVTIDLRPSAPSRPVAEAPRTPTPPPVAAAPRPVSPPAAPPPAPTPATAATAAPTPAPHPAAPTPDASHAATATPAISAPPSAPPAPREPAPEPPAAAPPPRAPVVPPPPGLFGAPVLPATSALPGALVALQDGRVERNAAAPTPAVHEPAPASAPTPPAATAPAVVTVAPPATTPVVVAAAPPPPAPPAAPRFVGPPLPPAGIVDAAKSVQARATAPAASPSATATDRASRALASRQPHPLVVLDAGHGGRDPGAEGVGGVLEKDVVLEITRLVARRLATRLPVDVIMTRSDDSYIPIERRLALPGEGATLFISVHANACTDPSARGLEVFYGGGGVRTASIHGGGGPAAVLGRALHHALQTRIGGVRGGARPGAFGVLVRNPVPSALIEIGYLTHPGEAARAQDAAFHELIADAVVDAVGTFLRASAPPL